MRGMLAADKRHLQNIAHQGRSGSQSCSIRSESKGNATASSGPQHMRNTLPAAEALPPGAQGRYLPPQRAERNPPFSHLEGARCLNARHSAGRDEPKLVGGEVCVYPIVPLSHSLRMSSPCFQSTGRACHCPPSATAASAKRRLEGGAGIPPRLVKAPRRPLLRPWELGIASAKQSLRVEERVMPTVAL